MKSGAVLYCRVSTDDQVENNSLPAQQRECATQAARLGCDVLDCFIDEGISGTREDRPAMAKMLAFCAVQRDRVRYVIVKDIDRFSRDVLVYHALRSRFAAMEIQLYSVNQPNIAEGTAEARLLEAMFSGISQYERDKIVQRTRDGTKEAIARGGWTCYAPYGYRTHRTDDNVPTLAIFPTEAAMVKKAYELFADGLTVVDVTNRLNVLGYRSKRDRQLSFQSIHAVLRNPVYLGKIRSSHFPDRLIDGRHRPIVSAELWHSVQDRIHDRSSASARRSRSSEFPLTGTLHCDVCDSPLTGSYSRSQTGRHYGYYHCRKPRCGSHNLAKAIVESNFVALLNRIALKPEWIDHLATELRSELKRRISSRANEERKFSRGRRHAEARRDRIEDSFFSGRIDEATYRRNLKRAERELDDLAAAKPEAAPTSAVTPDMASTLKSFFSDLSNSWEFGTVQHKRRIQALLFPEGIHCGHDGLYRTVTLPPPLAIISESKTNRSKLVLQIREGWNSLMEFVRSIDEFMRTSPASAGENEITA